MYANETQRQCNRKKYFPRPEQTTEKKKYFFTKKGGEPLCNNSLLAVKVKQFSRRWIENMR